MRQLLSFFIYILVISCFSCSQGKDGIGSRKAVTIQKVDGKWRFVKEGRPYFIKGGSGFEKMSVLAAIGGNTIRTWSTQGLDSILEEARRNKLSVIVGLDMPVSYTKGFYEDTAKTRKLKSEIEATIIRFKAHPAVLSWCLGNELDFPFHPKYHWFYRFFNSVTERIHSIDPDHPVTTSLVNIQKRNLYNLRLKVTGIDYLSINIFGMLGRLKQDLKNFSWLWDGPFLITEWAPNGNWETDVTAWSAPVENTSTKSAAQFTSYYNNYLPLTDDRFLGSLAFYWGNKQEYTHTWFSIFTEKGPTEIVEALRDCWNTTSQKHLAPRLSYLLLNEKGARDNILLAPGTVQVARLVFDHTEDSVDITYSWEIIREDWWGYKKPNWHKPEQETGLVVKETPGQLQFKTPVTEGPYRIFVTIVNKHGFAATANCPFYVVKP